MRVLDPHFTITQGMNQEDRNQILELISKNAYYYDFNQPEKRITIFTEDLHAETWLAARC
jgi:hypothetical protein